MRSFFRSVSLFALLAANVALFSPAGAQSDTRGLMDRLDRLERDLNTLQSQVYRGQVPSRPSSTASANDGGIGGNAYAMLDDRIAKMEEQIRDLTGQVERAQFSANQLSSKIDRIQSDNDVRFKLLEEKNNPPPLPAADPTKTADANAGPGAPPGFLGRPGDKPPAQGAVPTLPANKSASEQYEFAFNLLKNNDYDGANRAFTSFVAAHPTDPLAGSATYWLGQIAFAQNHYDQAAVIFLDSYTKYPKSAKAGESLLKVGMSMGALGKKKEACAALHRFQSEFSDASDSLKRQAAAERSKQGC